MKSTLLERFQLRSDLSQAWLFFDLVSVKQKCVHNLLLSNDNDCQLLCLTNATSINFPTPQKIQMVTDFLERFQQRLDLSQAWLILDLVSDIKIRYNDDHDCQLACLIITILSPLLSYFHHHKTKRLTTLLGRFQQWLDLSQAWNIFPSVSIKQKLVHNFVLTIDCNDDCQTFISHYIISPHISSYFHHNKIQGLTTLKARFQPRSDLSQAWIYLTLVSVMQKST